VTLLVAGALATTLVSWDLDSSDGGFVASGEAGQWAWGEVTNGPESGYTGTAAWATGLTADYLNDTTDYLEIPLPDLSAASRPALSFAHWYEIAAGDVAWVEVDAGNGWVRYAPTYGYPSEGGWTGSSGGWGRVGVDLRGLGPTPRLRLGFLADAAGVGAGWFVDDVSVSDGDVTPPRLDGLTRWVDTQDVDGPYVVQVWVEDDVAVVEVDLRWSVDGGPEVVSRMSLSEGTWSAEIPGQAPDTVVAYRVSANDGLNEAMEPALGTIDFRVYLPAPTGLRGPGSRVVGSTVTLEWTAPDAEREVQGYRVYRGELVVADVETTWAEVAVTGGGDDVYTVRAVYDVGEGDASEPVEIDAAVPSLGAPTPAEGFPGERLRLALRGEYLLMVQGQVGVELGEGIEVVAVDVRDVDRAWVDIEIAAAAGVGPRALRVQSGSGEVELAEAFAVRDPADRPRLASVTPDRVRQGEVVELEVELVGGLAADPVVDLGEGVVIEAVERIDADTVRVRVAVAPGAPVGPHPLTLDDGVRRYEGVEVEVRDVALTVGGTCRTASAAAGAPAGLLAALLLLARRRSGRRTSPLLG